MHPDDPCRTRGNHRLHAIRVEGVRLGIDVAEDRRDLLPLEGVRGGDERHGRDNYLPAQVEGAVVSSKATVALHMAMQCLTPRYSAASLELPHVGAVVGQPPAVDDVVEPREEPFPVADVRPADVQRLGERCRPAGRARSSTRVFSIYVPALGVTIGWQVRQPPRSRIAE